MKKGRSEFTENEILALKKLIDEKVKAIPENQKKIRQKIRNLNFYYSDFSSQKKGYTFKDVENLIHLGEIKIISNKRKSEVSIPKNEKIEDVKPRSEKPKLNNLKYILTNFRNYKFDPKTDSELIIPNEPGNYLISLKLNSDLPNSEFELSLKEFEKHKVIYTGIAGKNLRTRDYRQHFKGNNAGISTLRKSIGVLFGYKLIPRDKDPSTTKTKFSLNDEIELSLWMENNLIMHFYPNCEYDQIEKALIEHFNPPLNLHKNKNLINLEFRKNLSRLRNKKRRKYGR